MNKKLYWVILAVFLVHIVTGIIVGGVTEDYNTLRDEYEFIQAAHGDGWYKNEGFVLGLKTMNMLGLSTFWMRIILGFLSGLSVIPAYYLFKKFTRDDLAFYSSALFALNPFVLYYSSRILTETLSYIIAPLVMWLGLEYLEKQNTRYALLFGLTTIFFSIRHTALLFGLLFVGLYWLSTYRTWPKNILVGVAGGLIGLTPYVLFNWYTNHTMFGTALSLFKTNTFTRTYEYVFYYPSIINISWVLLPFILYFGYRLWKGVRLRKKYGTITIVFVIWIAIQTLFYFAHYPWFDLHRHLSIGTLGLSFIGVLGLREALKKIQLIKYEQIIIVGMLAVGAIVAISLVYVRFYAFNSILPLTHATIQTINQTINYTG